MDQQQPLDYAHPPDFPRANPIAIVAAVMSFFVPLMGILSIVLGYQLRRRGGTWPANMASINITCGVIGLFTSFVALSLLIPGGCANREFANRIHCGNNLRAIGQAIELYMADTKQDSAPPDFATLLNNPAALNALVPDTFVCPSSNADRAVGNQWTSLIKDNTANCSYIYIPGLTRNNASSSRPVVYEPLTDHDDDGANVLFGDGHVDWLTKKEVEEMVKSLSSGAMTKP